LQNQAEFATITLNIATNAILHWFHGHLENSSGRVDALESGSRQQLTQIGFNAIGTGSHQPQLAFDWK